jgi:CIC family chloride channel protein
MAFVSSSSLASSADSFGRALETTRYIRKWIGIAVLIGIVAGVGALVFSAAIHYATLLFLGMGALYLPPDPAGEGTTGILPIGRPWVLPLITALGGLLSGLIVFTFAPEAEGHGTDSAIGAIHFRQGRMRARVPLIKVIASAITIGSGGSAGREGPTAQISAGFGSILGDFLHLSDDDRRTAVAVGIGAGIGSIFRAPLGGAVLAAEILYLHDIEVEAIIPALIASIVGYSIYGSFTGFTPIFGNLSQFGYAQPIQLLYYGILGLVCGGVGILYAKCFYGTAHLTHRIPLPRAVKPAIGGLLVGCLGLVLPEVLGMGYGWVQVAMTPNLLGIPLWLLLVIPFAKIVATSLSIGTGGSGGIFGPGMVIGGMVGAGLWRLGHDFLPGMPTDAAPFIIIGMMALFGGIAHAPLAVMLMVAEMTGNLSLLAPAMLAVGIAYLVVGNNTIYSSQIPTRADSPAHRMRLRFPLLSSLTVAEAEAPAPTLLSATLSVAEAARQIEGTPLAGAPVVDATDNLVGVFTRGDLRKVPDAARATTLVADAMNREPATTFPTRTLDVALENLATNRIRWLIVLAGHDSRRVAGVVTAADIVKTYRSALSVAVRGVSGLAGGGDLTDLKVVDHSVVAGHTLAELRLMPETLVVSIRRDDEVLVPTASTILEPGDVVTVLNRGRRPAEVRRTFEEPVTVNGAPQESH